MKKSVFAMLIAASLPLSVNAATHTLDGRSLTVDQLWEIAQPGEDVTISKTGWQRINAGYKAPIHAAADGRSIYGLTVNYGALKDQRVAGTSVEDEPNFTASIKFNERQMRIQAAGVEPFISERESKMAMIIRLNQMAAGYTAMSTEGAQAFMDYINADVTPLIPSRGSSGANDLSLATHIGLSLMGEWDVMYKGERRNSKEVREELGLKPYRPFGLDGISILSNGNVAEAQNIAAVKKVEHLLDISPIIIASSLEALNGNVSPFLWHTVDTKGWPQGHEAAEAILGALKGSYLWDLDSKRNLQDPLSFRSSGYILATAKEELRQAKALLNTAINHTTDNPIVNTEARDDLWYSDTPAVNALRVGDDNVFVNSGANFDNTQLAVQMESLGRALAQVIHISAWRTTQLDDGYRTNLPTYLVAKENVGGDGFANIAQSMSGLYAEAMTLTNSATLYGVPTSVGIEETFSNVNLIASRVEKMADIGYEIYAYEVLHTTQGMEIRMRDQDKQMGQGTSHLIEQYRKVVPFVDLDRTYTPDINNGIKFLKTYSATK
ncbi:aromatic amino acid lyase [Shewanella schlegeliana]|uniref:Aromatic amino acid lyase n=1 Tax=Shewanella schlegeliana TaxID=190308 RepID=A0ABS1T2E1_9GAMM|nr:aromatic amino acid ammonia-lyase [Shewanella schlegeliana]MBL4914962.1 aromatic amino acid lyase [Shewanella schlegeliana]MCL1110626.1 aromatic amino acid lyase [Shewanella schlegeliana]GIU37891.1 phenylalanine ammonia-lyase [Shewanella schlegeliana]